MCVNGRSSCANHDELTLEMVTDAERDYLPLLERDRGLIRCSRWRSI